MKRFLQVSAAFAALTLAFSANATVAKSASRVAYMGAIGDSVLRGNSLPSCPPESTHVPCPGNFFDLALTHYHAGSLSFNIATDGRTAGYPGGGGLIGDLPRYCNAVIPGTDTKPQMAYTVLETGGNDVAQWRSGHFPGLTLRQVFDTYYVPLTRAILDCHPETKLILVSQRDSDWDCSHGNPSSAQVAHQLLQIQFDGYKEQLAASHPDTMTYMDVWGAHANPDGTGAPLRLPGKEWLYGSDMHGMVDGIDTGGNCVHPGTIGHKHLARVLESVIDATAPSAPRQPHLR